MSDPKSQHTIPQCYLKQFVDPKTPGGQEPYAWVFERDSKKGKKRAPKNILTETDVYTFKWKDGGKDYVLERTLGQFESDYSGVYERSIRQKIPLDKKEHAILCAFVAAMLQRTMKQKEHIEGFYIQLKTMVENQEKAHGIPAELSQQLAREIEDAHKMMIIYSLPIIASTLGKMNLAFLCADRRRLVHYFRRALLSFQCRIAMATISWSGPRTEACGSQHATVPANCRRVQLGQQYEGLPGN